ncbi:Predicted arabinose efflux permease, MFS family [Ferrithrix thermotolerans DSM 19514]|uniref:Predicted arabinose efflux permease, MFS family n=1 Tax=Ferrithrix thermotolerans DSM 19514 TaxID=1121881 RepID=A0A1M4VCJ5_9ACTN|nr:MFS transporter [Ferrithrix thermotolerans]SHE66691.1 Predicted arabinose efflux permease, MFS family [Ferrithrix thermotolerans DSM 19514]
MSSKVLAAVGRRREGAREGDSSYKWIALSNTTLGVLMATIDGSITLIALPDIFKGIGLDPLGPGNSFYLLWMILGFLVVTSVLVVSLGRLGDMYGRVKMYNLGFVIYTLGSLLLTVDWMHGRSGATWLIVMRLVQGLGSAFLVANSSAILTDAFPPNQRGMALGINQVAGISGSFIGLILGGVLAPINWRLVFLISVPIGIFGTVWSYYKLEERGIRTPSKIDWMGNLTFAVGLILILIGITYGIEPHGTSATGWSSPAVLSELGGGVALLTAFFVIETKVPNPMFRISLFRIKAFTFGTLSTFLVSIARGGLLFMLVIWLQGIWLPLHGYSFAATPLWAGIFMLPLTVGFLIAGPVSGYLSDRFGPRLFATIGPIGTAVAFVLLISAPVNFSYIYFGGTLLLSGLSQGLFASPNRAAVMNALPAENRGVGGAMNSTFQNSAQVFSIGIFFSLMIAGLSSSLPSVMSRGLIRYGVPSTTAERVAHLPAVSVLFSAFLGYDPIQKLLGSGSLSRLSRPEVSVLTGREFFPNLISHSFASGLHEAFGFALVACLVAALVSFTRGVRRANR